MTANILLSSEELELIYGKPRRFSYSPDENQTNSNGGNSMDVQITSPEAIGKALSKKNMQTMKDCMAMHVDAVAKCKAAIADHTKSMNASIKDHETAISKMQTMMDEYENAGAASVVKIV